MKTENTTPVDVTPTIVRDNNVPPTAGRIVHYVLTEGDSAVSAGLVRPAIIVALVDDGAANGGTVELQVFTRGGKDQMMHVHPVTALLDHEGAPGTWHWPLPNVLVYKALMAPPPEMIPSQDSLEDEIQKRLDAHADKKGYAVGEREPELEKPAPKKPSKLPPKDE